MKLVIWLIIIGFRLIIFFCIELIEEDICKILL